MNNKLVIIGDSFVTEQSYSKKFDRKKHFWCEIISQKCENIDVHINGDSSRDIQTIIDIWIKMLPKLTMNDYLVIIIPYFIRTRLPLYENVWHDSGIFNIIERFCGTDSYENNKELEIWGNKYNGDYFKNILESQEMINASKASQLNYIEIIQSLKLMSPSNTYIMSWDNMDYKSDVIDDKSILTKKMGQWETLDDEWIRTNGEYGVQHDFHWSLNMNGVVADYIINMFNLETKKSEDIKRLI